MLNAPPLSDSPNCVTPHASRWMAEGRISAEEFWQACHEFQGVAHSINDTWELLNVQDAGDVDDDDGSCLQDVLTSPADCLLTFEYHIVYSTSYGVPVLYFNIHRQDGSLVTLDEVWSLVPLYYQQRLEAERWTFITQQEHPLLRRPYFQLHPCHTADLMSAVSHSQSHIRNYILSWLSAVGPVVHLTLPLSYAEAFGINKSKKQ